MTVDVEGRPDEVVIGTSRLLELFAGLGVRGTFFVLGEVTQTAGRLLREIAAAGHEIGFHGWRHEFLSGIGPHEFARQLREWLPKLEDLAGISVRGFRAPYFSLQANCAWALSVLADAGLRYDASIYPAWNDRCGWPGAPSRPARLAGSNLVLFPVPLLSAALPVAFSGGAYLRMLPWAVVVWGMRRQSARGLPGMIYTHPWELLPPAPWTEELRASTFWLERWRIGRQILTNRPGRGRLRERLEKVITLVTPARLKPMAEVVEQLGPLPEWRPPQARRNEAIAALSL